MFSQLARRPSEIYRKTGLLLRLSPVSREVRQRRLTYLKMERLRVLERCVSIIEAEGIDGDVLECGIALGGSAAVLAKLATPRRSFHGYDVFGMIPPPGPRDPPDVHERYARIVDGGSRGIAGDEYYGYRPELRRDVERVLESVGRPVGDRVQLHEGLFEDTLHPPGPVALAHVDSDWFDPVDTCLRRIGPMLSRGGLIVLDDYDDYGGCREAVDAYLAEHPSMRLIRLSTNVAVQRTA